MSGFVDLPEKEFVAHDDRHYHEWSKKGADDQWRTKVFG
jgi:hypothetical protein